MLNVLLFHTADEPLARDKEGMIKTLIGMLLHLNRIYYIPEVQNITGRTDPILLKNNKAYIIEVKIDGQTKQAIQQIDENYVSQFIGTAYEGNITKIGVNLQWKEKCFDVEIV